jgi:hypothetical protein
MRDHGAHRQGRCAVTIRNQPMRDGPPLEERVVRTLLRRFKWTLSSRNPGYYEVWRHANGETELLVPLDSQKGDYSSLMSRARRSLFEIYGSEASNIATVVEVQYGASLEVTQWRKQTPLEPGIIAWDEGERLYSSAKAQLAAAAKATRERRRYHGNASSYVARQFLESSFMGQTEVGSFVITAMTPALQRISLSRPVDEPEGLFPRERESVAGHQIMDTFADALMATRDGLDEYAQSPRVELFLERVGAGVSHEFALAIRDLTIGSDAQVEIHRFASSGQSPATLEVAFKASESAVLDKVATAFAADPEPLPVSLLGDVTLLSRSGSRLETERVIRLNVEHGATVRKARIRLSAQQYDLAMEAHRLEASLRVRGTLEKEGNLYWVYDPHDVEIVPNDESEAAARAVNDPNDGQEYLDIPGT